MTQSNSLITRPIQTTSLVKRMLVGAGIGLVLISLFLISAGEPNPEWGTLWRLKPLIIVPFAGAGGGLFYYIMMDHIRFQVGWQKALAFLFSFIVFIIALWLGTVLGLNGTYWH